MSATSFSSPYGEVSLQRYPGRARDLLLPFDGADRYLLEELHDRLPAAQRILVVGEAHGAVTTSLARTVDVDVVSDSYLACTATARNLARNGLSARIRPEILSGYDAVAIRAPKSAERLVADLTALSSAVRESRWVVVGGMAKHLGRWVNGILEQYVGPATASLGRHKARLIHAVPDERPAPSSPQPPPPVPVPGTDLRLQTAPGSFSAGGLDLGTRALLDQLPSGLGAARVADLGCGSGVLAIASALLNPQAEYLLVDESYAAVDCARANWATALGDRPAKFVVGDGLSRLEPESLDVVVCNPPFHAGHLVEAWIAQRLLAQAARALRPGGSLYVVGNRHLDHGGWLRQRFTTVHRLAATPRFTVSHAIR